MPGNNTESRVRPVGGLVDQALVNLRKQGISLHSSRPELDKVVGVVGGSVDKYPVFKAAAELVARGRGHRQGDR